MIYVYITVILLILSSSVLAEAIAISLLDQNFEYIFLPLGEGDSILCQYILCLFRHSEVHILISPVCTSVIIDLSSD